jgi:acetate---CoA ligase (ADP-forming)
VAADQEKHPRHDLRRLLAPRSVALIGSGAWTDAVADGAARLGYPGEVWRVHPTRDSTAQTIYFRSIDDLPGTPDSAFVAVPNADVPSVASALERRGAGGFVCFSSGFAETATETGAELTARLLESAGSLPFLGPNCYGMVNFFDRVALWPDQVVGGSPERGVAIICQSGTIALTLMFNQRSVPIGYLLTIGNQARLAAEDLIEALCDDDRVSAFGLYLEGVQDAERFTRAAARARAAGKPIALVKAGRTAQAAAAALSHTGALVGSDAVFDAYCREAGIARCDTLATLCETLKLLHAGGPLRGRRICVMGASGGDMAMTADVARHLDVEFPPFGAAAAARLRTVVSDRVRVANPFDVHTYLWFDHPAMQSLFEEVFREDFDAVAFMLDCPPVPEADDSAYTPVIERFVRAAQGRQPRGILLSSLPETASADTRARCLAAGVVPLQGQREGLEAIALAAAVCRAAATGAIPALRRPPAPSSPAQSLSEYAGKQVLAAAGVPIPRGMLVRAADAADAAAQVGFPVAIKASGAALQHKTERGAVVLGVTTSQQAAAAGARLAALSDEVLVEAMITDAVAEFLVGVSVDPQFGQVLMVGGGGIWAEALADTQLLLPPWTPGKVEAAVRRLRIARLLDGWRGKPRADVPALVQTICAIGRYAEQACDILVELDVNPVLVLPEGRGAIAVDALVRLHQGATT